MRTRLQKVMKIGKYAVWKNVLEKERIEKQTSSMSIDVFLIDSKSSIEKERSTKPLRCYAD